MTRQRNDLTRFEEQQQIERARALGPELAECLRELTDATNCMVAIAPGKQAAYDRALELLRRIDQ